MSSPSRPDWLSSLIAEEGDSRPIDAHERDALFGALNAAYQPQTLDQNRHRQIIDRALGLATHQAAPNSVDPLGPARPEELAAAAELRDNFDSNQLVLSLRSAHLPSPPLGDVETTLRQVAIEKTSRRVAPLLRRLTRPAWGIFAAAAAAALWFITQSNGIVRDARYSRPKTDTLVLSRSTESLFAKPFAQSTNSERIDKIALVRSRELRNNRYAIWGLP